ncbi:pyridoxal phosphate-dependent aminotransferase [Vulcanisaeta souniana]|uniref:Aminotransferase n=1 Tax=Vulcanisaeta souniana JCM 11219 TaxID=1293586 RepID=A0A830EC21_9CREN|nr:pyridoxal phosphate-dependent aminotransferase [Vulcanisaeta souniana]BDR92661.1 aspartate aminotransferase [Vulcanisaeta souniana JCM 11219]GGI84529.1 aspartate aminotransferase [Vulcanisaeta souniana JCM 11219]
MNPINDYLKGTVKELQGEKAFTYLAKAREITERKGIKIISFGIGQPDLPTFDNIINAAKRALDEKFTGYTETEGIKELREAIADYLNYRYHAGVRPDEVIVTTGTKTAIFLAIAAYVRPGDEVIIPDPTYPAYPELTKLFGGKPIYVAMKFDPEDGFRLDLEAIENSITPRTKAIVINNPHNPTGAVFRPEEVTKLLEIAKDYKLLVVVDEIYDNFVYESSTFRGILELEPEWRNYVLYTNGFSKTFSMTGWRLGYLVASREVIDPIRKLAANTYSCPPSIAQRAGVEALRSEASWRSSRAMIELFRRRRDVMYEELRKIPGIDVWRSTGAFYMYPRVRKILDGLGMNVDQFADWLLENYGVVVLPGTAFSETNMGRDYVRLSFALDEELIKEGIDRLRKAVEK